MLNNDSNHCINPVIHIHLFQNLDMIWFLILIMLCLFIVYLLFMKLILYIDTENSKYYIQAKGLIKAHIEEDRKELFRIHLRVLFMNFYFYPLNSTRKSKSNDPSKKAAIKKHSQISFKKGIRILRTFKIKKFDVKIDTGNCITNAKLYPLFSALNHHLANFRINFEGNNQLILFIQNRPINIIRAIINT